MNNTGQMSLVKKTSLLEVDRAVIDLNTIGTISLTKAVLPHMIECRQGQIVVVSSVLGKFGNWHLHLLKSSFQMTVESNNGKQ